MRSAALAAVLYGGLLVASLVTLTDWRIRLVTVAVILMFAARTLWQPRPRTPGIDAALRGRPADVVSGNQEVEQVQGPM